MEEIDFAVKYPFTSQAKKLLEEVQLTDSIILKGIERIKASLESRRRQSIAIHKDEKLEEIASFAAARMALGYLRNRYITNKFAVAESKTVSSNLASETEDEFQLLSKELNIQSTNQGWLPIPLYLKNSPRSIDYKLINRNIKNGLVAVNRRELSRLMEEAVRKHIESTPMVKSIPDSMKNALEDLIKQIPRFEPQTTMSFKQGANPPCIEKLLDSLKKHENLNHQARWGLAVYLVNKGVTIENLISLYSNLPDFSEKITQYQLEHIKKKNYTMPSCATMLTYGLCCADCKIGNPLNWKNKRQV
ncbi:hypothetical protein HYT84_04260 [Candidatus Micrarchaeota archaeon]|nr:hypothetical protein [Candidatus Micrarchaeota archaeon]